MNEYQTTDALHVNAGRGAAGCWRDEVVAEAADRLERRLLACGSEDAPVGEIGRALREYWAWLALADIDARRALVQRLGHAIAQDRRSLRAWVPVILGDNDFEVVQVAARAFVNARPVSLERLEQRVADTLDWIRRGLALNRSAVFAALLEGAGDDLLARLAGLRSTLSGDEARAVWRACDGVRSDAAREFLEEWRAREA